MQFHKYPVNRKLVGEYAVVNLSTSNGKPIPTLFGLGVICSSLSFGLPAPNCICRLVADVNLVANLLCIFSNCNK